MLEEWLSDLKKSASPQNIASNHFTASSKKFDVIIAGAGPAGASAAYFIAREGLDVLLLERGPYPGSKTCGGSSVVTEDVHRLFPNFWEELEYERLITSQAYWLVTDDSVIQIGYCSMRLGSAPFNRFSVRRVHLYKWLVKKAEEAGATVLFNHNACDVLKEGKYFVGVRISLPQDITYIADIIILADGVNSLLGEKAGVRKKVSPSDIALYAKETIALPFEIIEERFNLPPGHGAIIGLLGYPTAGFNGTGSIHTFRSSVNISVGMSVLDMAKSGISPCDLIKRIKSHDYIKPFIEGGVPTEFGASLIPEGGYRAIPELVHPGLMIIGDAASLVNGVQGFNLAMWSGFYAAQAAVRSKMHRDFSIKSLSLYRTLLEESFVLQDMRANAPQASWLKNNPYFFDLYTRILNEGAFHVTKSYTMPKKAKRRFIFKKVTSLQPLGKIVRDAWRLLKVVR